MWAGRTVALLHCRTACTAEPANVRTFPSLSARSLDMCAHFLPRHLAKAGPFVRTFGRVRKVRTFFGCVRGDLQHPAKCAHKSRDGRLRGREMCAHSPWFSGATVQQCDGATRKRPWRTEQRSAGWAKRPREVWVLHHPVASKIRRLLRTAQYSPLLG